MKVTLDLTKLLEDGQISRAEHDRMLALSATGTASLAINILVAFGVIAVSGALIALVPTAATTILIGIVVSGAGLFLVLGKSRQWELFATICLLAGALILSGGIAWLGEGSLASLALITLILAAGGIVARSSLLIAASVLALSSCLGARTGYFHATYMLAIDEPTLTILVFSLLALAAYLVSQRLRADYERLALTAARTSLVLVNFGFWVGSLWGDRLTWLRGPATEVSRAAVIPDWAFVIGWALALAAVAVWAARRDRRWVLNAAAIFGAIHFYTQWFERLGATPFSVLLAGLLALAFAIGLWRYNQRAAAHS